MNKIDWEKRKTKLCSVSKVVTLVALVALFLSFPIMRLWNWLAPLVFGLVDIDFWQAYSLSLPIVYRIKKVIK